MTNYMKIVNIKWLLIVNVLLTCAVTACADSRWVPIRGSTYGNPNHLYAGRVPPEFVACALGGGFASTGIRIPLNKTRDCLSNDRLAIYSSFLGDTTDGGARDLVGGECRLREDENPAFPFIVEEAGKLMSGLDTIICTRSDVSSGRYTKRVLALLELEDNGPIAYTIVVYADLKDKAKADDLLAQVIAGFEIER